MTHGRRLNTVHDPDTAHMPPKRVPRDHACPACQRTFSGVGQLAKHLRQGACVITEAHLPQMIELGIVECTGCHQWFSSQGLGAHERACVGSRTPERGTSDLPDAGAVSQSDRATEFVLCSTDRLRWLDSLDWETVGRCPYSTISPPKGGKELYCEAHKAVDALFEKQDDDRAWKLHFFIIRVLFAPSGAKREASRQSVKKLVQGRCRAFLRGEWLQLWEAANAAPRMGVTPIQVSEAAEAVERQKRIDQRARAFAKEGELSKAMSVFDSGVVLDPNDPDIMRQLVELHEPPTVEGIIPGIPEGFDEPDWEFELKEVELPTAEGAQKKWIESVEFVRQRLKRGVAQSLSGARYEHYQCLPFETLKRMVQKILNGTPSEGVRAVLTACRMIALDKGGRKVRPVAIGEAIRRIAARVVCVQDNEAFSAILTSVMQFGVGVKGGIEYAYHSIRLHMLAMHDEFEAKYYGVGSDGGDAEVLEKDIPGVLKVDFRNGYNSTSRAKMLAQVQAKFPHLLRFARFCYAQQAKLVVMHAGGVVGEIESVFGTQQGDPLGGHFFALSIFQFMANLQSKFPESCVSWIVDDLTVSDTQDVLGKVAEFIKVEGPEYGLFKNDTKGEFYSPHGAKPENVDWKPNAVITEQYGYSHAVKGFKLLLGAPFGEENFEREQAELQVLKLLKNATCIKRIQDRQLEFVLLRYCVATVPMHLCRMVEPHIVARGLHRHEVVVREQLQRIAADAGQQIVLSPQDWAWAKLPVREGGLGLQDLPLISEVAFMAAMGAVARRASKVHHSTGSVAAQKVRAWFDDDNDQFERALAKVAEKVNKGDAAKPICPSLPSLESMPSQKILSTPIYVQRRKELLQEPMTREDRAWKLSCGQFGAGIWLNCIPMLKRFVCASSVFAVMLQIRLGLWLKSAELITQCKCGDEATRSRAMQNGRHWMTVCKKAQRGLCHDAVRDVIHRMYRIELKVATEVEVAGLFSQLKSDGQHRPADVLVPASASEGGVAQALDVVVTDPTSKSGLRLHSDKVPLKAASEAYMRKMQGYRRQLEIAGQAGLPFVKVPLAFETTGAMGEETQQWWQSVLRLESEQRGDMLLPSRRELGEDHTWTANSFVSFWLQSISMAHARKQAESVMLWVGKCQP